MFLHHHAISQDDDELDIVSFEPANLEKSGANHGAILTIFEIEME